MLDRFFGTKRALLVDGPNLLRSEFEFDLEDVRRLAEEGGKLHVARVYLDHRAPPSLVEAVETNGMEAVVTSGDVDVKMGVDAAELAFEGYDLVIATRDADFKPVVEKANQLGARTTVVGLSEGFSSALESVADEVVLLDAKTS